jgi:hypothetical protein
MNPGKNPSNTEEMLIRKGAEIHGWQLWHLEAVSVEYPGSGFFTLS